MIAFKSLFFHSILSLFLLPINHFGQSPSGKLQIDLTVILEGPYSPAINKMETLLFKNGYLPGMKPRTFFGLATGAGQPYNKEPWSYAGKEGLEKGNLIYNTETVDWILVELLPEDKSEVIRFAALLQSDGKVQALTEHILYSVTPGNKYFIQIHHRNHLPVITQEAVEVDKKGISWDFSRDSESSQKYLGDGLYGMVAGNGFISGALGREEVIDELDLKEWSEQNNHNSSYLQNDYDLNGDVNIRDQRILLSNLSKKKH